MTRIALIVLAALLAVAVLPAAAQMRRGEPRLADSIEVLVLPRRIVAVGAGDGTVEASLDLNEEVRLTRSQGDVAVAVTDRRILAIGIASSRWEESAIRLSERHDVDVELGQRISLLTTSQRLLGFAAPGGGRLVEHDIGPNERLIGSRVGESVAVAVTDRHALGLSAEGGGFVAQDLRLHEDVRAVSTRAASASVRTSQRVLTFDARSRTWSEAHLPLH